MTIKVGSVVFINWSGDYTSGEDDVGYYCLPRNYYVYMPIRVCSFNRVHVDEHSYRCAGIQYDLGAGGFNAMWNVIIHHLDEVYDQRRFLTSLLITPHTYWPSPERFKYIEDVREDLDYHNRHVI